MKRIGKVIFQSSPKQFFKTRNVQLHEENTLSRFIKARESLEVRNHERIDKLKKMLAKHVLHDKNAKEFKLETIEEWK